MDISALTAGTKALGECLLAVCLVNLPASGIAAWPLMRRLSKAFSMLARIHISICEPRQHGKNQCSVEELKKVLQKKQQPGNRTDAITICAKNKKANHMGWLFC